MKTNKTENLKITIFDMQPITPQVGGGRIRLAGLYHKLGDKYDVTYFGSYDWRGEKYRDQMTYENLREICIPLSDEHFRENEKLTSLAGFNSIDMMFNKLGFLSNDFLQKAKKLAYESDILIFSHPWVYPLVKDVIDHNKQLIVHDAQNHEGLLRYDLYKHIDNDFAELIIKNVVSIEYELCKACDVTLACSEDDLEHFKNIYEIESNKLKFIPNGVFFNEINKHKATSISQTKKALFMGSNYAPNIEAAKFIINHLADKVPTVQFIIAGGVCSEIKNIDKNNVKLLGRFSEEEKINILANVDLAINPMFSGSGTNIKMFDFMAANLPIVSTSVGARGIIEASIDGIVIADQNSFAHILNNWDFGKKYNTEMIAKNNFAFENITKYLGYYLKSLKVKKKNNIFLFSTWNMLCGIADHSRQLADALYEANEVSILGNNNQDLYASSITEDIKYSNVYKVWHYDHTLYKESSVDIDAILSLVKNKNSLFILHYHFAFFSIDILIDLITRISSYCQKLVLTLHNANIPDNKIYEYLAQNKHVQVVVHNNNDARLLRKKNINPLVFFLGVPNQESNSLNIEKNLKKFKIGGFGFLREHKGIFNIIETLNSIENGNIENGNIEYYGLHSLINNEESVNLLKKCNNFITENALQNRVKLNTSFLSLQDIMKELSNCDMILLPYNISNEGSSASASMAFSIGVPVCVTNTHIFNSIKKYTLTIEDNSVENIKMAILKLMNDNVEYDKYSTLSRQYRELFSITKTAENYVNLRSEKT